MAVVTHSIYGWPIVGLVVIMTTHQNILSSKQEAHPLKILILYYGLDGFYRAWKLYLTITKIDK